MVRTALFMVLTLGLNSVAQAQGVLSWRLALVSSTSSDPMNNLLDLAQAKLSAEPKLDLLDRKAIGKVLAEQKLSLSGLVDSSTAVDIGKLLTAHTFALIETDTQGKEALGLSIYDVETGIKWVDRTLPVGLENQVETVVEAVKAVAKKRSAGTQAWRTVCILSTRNADLPRSQDHVAPTVALLLERHLLASPSLAVLERKRLDWVTKEKNLPTASKHKDLLASLVTVEVEVSRADKNIRATAYLSDSQGKELGKVRAESKTASAEELANGLLAEMVRALKAAPTGATPNRHREGQRFFLEGQRLATHRQWPQAVRSLEAAHALDPEHVPTHVHLTNALIEGGIGGYALQKNYSADDIKSVFRAALRAYDLRRGAMERAPLDTAGLRAYSQFQPKTSSIQLWLFRKHLIDDECRELLQQVKTAFVGMATAEWKQSARAMEGAVFAERKGQTTEVLGLGSLYFGFSVRLNVMMLNLRVFPGIALQEQETVALEWLQTWLPVTRLPELFPYSDHANRMFASPYPFSNSPRFLPFYKSMSQHPDPLLHLWGSFYTLSVERHQGKISPAEADKAFQDIKTSALRLIGKVDVTKAPRVSKVDPRLSFYHFLFEATKIWPFADPEAGFRERFALCDSMLRRKELVRDIFVPTVDKTAYQKNQSKFHAERWDLIDKALVLVEAGPPSLCELAEGMPNQLLEIQRFILSERPDFAERVKMAAGPRPWQDARLLVRPAEIPLLRQLGPPSHHNDVIVLPICRVLSYAKKDYRVEVLRIAEKEQKGWKKWVEWTVPAATDSYDLRSEISSSCWGGGRWFFGTRHGLFAVSEKGELWHVNKDIQLPAADVRALAFHDGKLYIFLEGSYLIAFDPESKQFETLASSRRRERLSPFDDAESFQILGMTPDPPRDRLLFVLYQRPKTFDIKPAKDATNGLWEYNWKTKKFTRHIELFYQRYSACDADDQGHWLLSGSGIGKGDVLGFEFKTNQARTLLGLGLIGPYSKPLPLTKAPHQSPEFPMFPFFAMGDGFFWAVAPGSVGQVCAKDGKLTMFQEFAVPPNQRLLASWCGVQRVGSKQLLLQNQSGLWLLNLSIK